MLTGKWVTAGRRCIRSPGAGLRTCMSRVPHRQAGCVRLANSRCIRALAGRAVTAAVVCLSVLEQFPARP